MLTINILLSPTADFLWYASIAAGICGLALCAARDGLDVRDAFVVGLLGIAGGFLGGSVMVTGGLPPGISLNPATWLEIVYVEKSVIGVVAGGAILAATWPTIRGQSVLRYADAAAPAFALAYVIARLDCYAHGHCFGIPSDLPWAVTFTQNTQAFVAQVASGLIEPEAQHTVPVHPTQLYLALLGVAIFIVLLRMRADAPGKRLAAGLVLYGAGRFVIEFFRGDAVPVLGVLDANHIAALLMLMTGLTLWRLRTMPVVVPERRLSA